jgi:hypothetical protein
MILSLSHFVSCPYRTNEPSTTNTVKRVSRPTEVPDLVPAPSDREREVEHSQVLRSGSEVVVEGSRRVTLTISSRESPLLVFSDVLVTLC